MIWQIHPSQMIQVRLHQYVYDRCYKKQAQCHLHGSGAEEYIKKKFSLGDCVMETIDWEGIALSNRKLSLTEQATRSKYVYWWLYTNLQDNCFQAEKDKMCPLCRKVEEHQHHVQYCLDPGVCKERSGFRDILETELAQIHTHPDLTTLLFWSMMLQNNRNWWWISMGIARKSLFGSYSLARVI